MTIRYLAAITRKALAVFLTFLFSSGARGRDPSDPNLVQSQLLEFRGDVQALVQSLPDLFRQDEMLVRIVAALAAGYPKEFQALEIRADERLLVCFAGQKFIYNDGAAKTFAQRLDHPDIEDMFCQLYPLANPLDRMPKDFDPGRYRVEPLFRVLYGESEASVARNCVAVDFCGHAVKFNARCGAADALRAVSAELEPMLMRSPELRRYVEKLGGTFNWRKIDGTERLSNHSFGTAIDLNVEQSAYWRWQSPEQMETFSRKGWPSEIVEIFERHGFIWGGKWWHFDTMHFEYRPEIIAYAKLTLLGIAKIRCPIRSAVNER
jgi:D-alanyl-D-alanine carboxypeptidase